MYDEEKNKIKEGESTIRFHIGYTEKPQLKELIAILNCINKGYNDVLRKKAGMANKKLSKYSPTIEDVDRGSIVLIITVNISITAGLAMAFIRFFQNRCQKMHKKTKFRIKTEFLDLKIEKELFID